MFSDCWATVMKGRGVYQRRNAVAVIGVLALTGTVVLAGCGGSTSAATAPAESAAAAASTPDAAESAVAEPAAPESAAADVPTGATDGLVKPAGVSDEDWTGTLTIFKQLDGELAGTTPEELAKACDDFGNSSNKEAIAELVASGAKDLAEAAGGSVEEWTVVYGRYYDNARIMACSMAGLSPVTVSKGSTESDDYSDSDDSELTPE
jgi:hypothetical protein